MCTALQRVIHAGMLAMVAIGPTVGFHSDTVAATDKADVMIEKVEYGGWKNNLKLSNGTVELIATLDVGPRILSFRPTGGKNVFKEFADQLGKSSEKDWVPRGGHRLWAAPEDLTRTYAPDNRPVRYQEAGPGVVRLIQEPDQQFGIQKEMEVRLAPTGSRVTVVHRITNVGKDPTELAVWALTMMTTGGTEIIPLPPRRPHPGPPANARSPEDYAPVQTMILWPYSDFKDPRWGLGHKYITLRQDEKRGPTKIGLFHQMGWTAYLVHDSLFVKHVGFERGKMYPDRGCNYETFTNEEILEMESLGPMVKLAPGETAELTERWDLHKEVPAVSSEEDIDRYILPKIRP